MHRWVRVRVRPTAALHRRPDEDRACSLGIGERCGCGQDSVVLRAVWWCLATHCAQLKRLESVNLGTRCARCEGSHDLGVHQLAVTALESIGDGGRLIDGR
jgi:hypothetical protein